MSYGIKLVELATAAPEHGGERIPIGSWLRSYDPEGHDGLGDARFTMDPTHAMRFDTPADALLLWRSVPATRPVRDDGLPNRPLTAFTVEVVKLP